jgi:hypothetical protein
MKEDGEGQGLKCEEFRAIRGINKIVLFFESPDQGEYRG